MLYLKVWTDFRVAMEPLNDAEKGRLFDAMLKYAEDGEEPHLTGNERFLWAMARQSIDRTRTESERLKANGSKGGRPKKQSEPTETKRNQTKATDERFERFWAAYPRKVGKGKAQESFKKIKPSEELTKRMLDAVNAQMKSAQWQEDGGRYIPNPATWLNQSRWEDEPGKAFNPGIKSEAAQRYEQRPVEDEDELPSWYGE